MLRTDQVHLIRHEVLVESQSIKRVSQDMGVSRSTVRKYLRVSVAVRVQTRPGQGIHRRHGSPHVWVSGAHSRKSPLAGRFINLLTDTSLHLLSHHASSISEFCWKLTNEHYCEACLDCEHIRRIGFQVCRGSKGQATPPGWHK